MTPAAPRLLPRVETPADYYTLPAGAEAYQLGAIDICRRHSLDASPVERYDGGSSVVLAVGDAHVIKLFPPLSPQDPVRERAGLAAARGCLDIETPEIVGDGQLEGWSYLIMTRLAGIELSRVWGELSDRWRRRLLEQVGHALAQLHGQRPDPAATDSWSRLLKHQQRRAYQHHAELGLAAPWLDRLPAFLDSVDLSPASGEPLAWVHGDLVPEHLLIERQGPGWRLRGLIDFEASHAGPAELDLALAGIFLARGHAPEVDALLTGYGDRPMGSPTCFQQRMMACALLREHSFFTEYLKLLPPREARNYQQLAAEWWPLREIALCS